LEIESPRGKGTTLRVRLPLTGSAANAETSSAQVGRPLVEDVADRTGGEQAVELGSMSGAVRT